MVRVLTVYFGFILGLEIMFADKVDLFEGFIDFVKNHGGLVFGRMGRGMGH